MKQARLIISLALSFLFLVSMLPAFVVSSASFVSASSIHVVARIAIGSPSIYIFSGPSVYNPSNNYVYVIVGSDTCGKSFCNYVSVINGATNKVVTKLTIVGTNQNLLSLAYDPSNSGVYVLSENAQSNYFVSAIKGIQVTATIKETNGKSLFSQSLIYDPASKNMIASGNDSIFVIDGATNKIVKTVSVGTYGVQAMSYDPANKNLYVVTAQGGNPYLSKTYVINAITYKIITTRAWPGFAACFGWFTYDPLNKDMYYGDFCAGLFVISSGTSKEIGHIANSFPFGVGSDLTFNPANKEIYIWNGYTIPNGGAIEIMSTSTNHLIGNIGSLEGESLIYDGTNNDVYVVGICSQFANYTCYGSVSAITSQNVIAATIPLGSAVCGCITYDPSNTYMYIPTGSTLTVVSS